MRVLFVMRSLGYLRFFQLPLELMVERGHEVRLLLGRADHGPVQQSWLDDMLSRPNFSCDVDDHTLLQRHDRIDGLVRRILEYLRYSEPGERNAALLRMRRKEAPPLLRRLRRRRIFRTRAATRIAQRLLAIVDRALGIPPAVLDYVHHVRPDVLALCDYGGIGSLYSHYVRAARRLGIPSVVCVASWDNLTTRQAMREVPDRVLVWNETQVREAVEIHGIPPGRVVTTGAPGFDEWFAWSPRPRAQFLAGVGLDPALPVVLWVGGALFEHEAGRREGDFAAEWVAALRSAADPALREVGVLLRPHPLRVDRWLDVDFSGFGNAVVWPKSLTMPVDAELKADYFDSIHHAFAVVGLNSSAMIEASIVGRPVAAVLAPEFHDSQRGAFHFSYLLDSSGGAVQLAESVEEHFAMLRALLEGDTTWRERSRRFVASFVRPHGLDRAATPIFVDELERAASLSVEPEREPLWAPTVRGVLRIVTSAGNR